MNTYTVEYLGKLRTRLRHDESATEIYTDAPRDNQGEGSSFSPTDLVAAAVGSCMFTIMGIRAVQSGIEIRHLKGQVKKIMGGPPRRIVGVEVRVRASIAPDSLQYRRVLEEAARTCPVILSLHPEIKKEIIFEWD
ncbi:MAG: OsmC family protein [Flavobacteriales bacterium]|nr:OsmC family protein [Flavobacteriales bacterium]MCX7767504.1 OsmC family protein [Flavobacteriales bacterium]MDW8409639.1 OsmC family protein [Flavobacteriales bacterium]